jgi:GTP cyclohydrolase I-like protein
MSMQPLVVFRNAPATMDLAPRIMSDEQMHRLEGYAAEIFTVLGLDLDTPATIDTPRRFIRALFDATAGYDGDPKLVTVFETECRSGADCRLSQVVEGPIQFYALCEHHALPFYGRAYIGYIADEHIIGISKMRGLSACSLNVLRFRNESVSRLPTRWRRCSSRMAWRFTSKPITSACRCAASRRRRR